MKTKMKWIPILSLLLLAFFGCSKEEVVVPEKLKTETKPEVTVSLSESTDGEITLYTVNGSDLIKKQDYSVAGSSLAYQRLTDKHQEIWAMVLQVIPESFRGNLSEFLIFSGEENSTAGFVVQTSNDLSKWQMGIAIDFAYQSGFNAGGELAYTIIHEFAHILTLNNTQIDASIGASSCSNYFPGEGCANTDSYINQLYLRFWADIWSEYQAATDSEYAQQEFYDKYKDRFVTQYASTNPGEDIAESFTYFVTLENKPTGNPIADQKVLMMYEYPELIELRNYIRTNLMTTAKSSQRSLPKAGTWKQANTFGDPKQTHNKTKL